MTRLDWLTCLDDDDAAGFFYAAHGFGCFDRCLDLVRGHVMDTDHVGVYNKKFAKNTSTEGDHGSLPR